MKSNLQIGYLGSEINRLQSFTHLLLLSNLPTILVAGAGKMHNSAEHGAHENCIPAC